MGKEGGGGEVGSLPAGPSDCSGLQVAAAPSPAQARPHLSTTQWGLGSMVGAGHSPCLFHSLDWGVLPIGHCFSKVAKLHNSWEILLFIPRISSRDSGSSSSSVGLETFFFLHLNRSQ